MPNDLIPHVEDIRLNLQLKGLPDKIVSYRNKKGILKKINPSEGGTVTASKAELFINGQTYQINDMIGASINARTKSIDPLIRIAERKKINSRYIAKNKSTQKAVQNKETVDHAEQDNLGKIGDKIDSFVQKKGINISKKKIQGKIYMHVERYPCSQCTANIFNKNNKTEGPLYLFSKEYQNIEIIITNDDFPGKMIIIKNGKKTN